jgi:DNA invertase Pin-like site-specific DNA recombinase
MKRGEVDVVVCTTVDRLAGNPQELMSVMQELEESGVDLEVIL